jgi:glycosyltransferase involved in cell wall biosynthesis
VTGPAGTARPRLSVTIIARDEEDRLPACLDSLAGIADEVILLDTGSTDGTVSVAEAAGARVERGTLDGFGPAKQRAVDDATGDWVLSIDADERLTPALRAEIVHAITSPQGHDGYELRRQSWFLGRRMRFGGMAHDHVLRLFRRAAGRFTDAAVHERVVVRGTVGRLSAPLEHHTIRSRAEFRSKIERYAALRAREMAARGIRGHWWDILRLPATLFVFLVVRLSLLDGPRGVLWAAGSAYHSWRKYDLLRERPLAGPPWPT